MTAISEFIQQLIQSIEAETFAKLGFSQARREQNLEQIQQVFARQILLKSVPHLSFTLRYPFKDITKNIPLSGVDEAVRTWLGAPFQVVHLHTTLATFILEADKKGEFRLKKTKPAITVAPTIEHNRSKHRRLEAKGNKWLRDLGITNAQGDVLKEKQAKFKQIDKYLEIIEALLTETKLSETPFVADMGAGKGYLTFALHSFLQYKGFLPQTVGVEFREDMVGLCNQIATDAKLNGLEFMQGTIQDFSPAEKMEVLIALHACDTATDDAILKGIQHDAKLIVCAPCCHKQVRKAMKPTGDINGVLQYGILLERQAELLTDGIRALLLTAYGYKTKVMEFISLEHTGKNVLLIGIKTANKDKNKEDILRQIQGIKKEFGISFHYLEDKLLALFPKEIVG